MSSRQLLYREGLLNELTQRRPSEDAFFKEDFLLYDECPQKVFYVQKSSTRYLRIQKCSLFFHRRIFRSIERIYMGLCKEKTFFEHFESKKTFHRSSDTRRLSLSLPNSEDLLVVFQVEIHLWWSSICEYTSVDRSAITKIPSSGLLRMDDFMEIFSRFQNLYMLYRNHLHT